MTLDIMFEDYDEYHVFRDAHREATALSKKTFIYNEQVYSVDLAGALLQTMEGGA